MRKNFFKGFLVLLLALSFITFPVKADEFVTTGISSSEKVEKVYLDAGDDLNVSANVLGSSFVAGNNVTVGGSVDGILFLAGNNIKHKGVASYAAIAGNMIEVSGVYEKDVAIAGNSISIRSEASFGRDVVIMGSDITLSGIIERDIAIYGSNINMENVLIKGSAEIYGEKISFSENAKVDGNLKTNLDVDSKYVGGEITKVETPDVEVDISVGSIIYAEIINYVSLLATFLVLFLICPKVFKAAKETEFEAGKVLSLLGTGIICLVFVPVVSILLLITVIGIPVSLIALAVYCISLYLANIFTGYYIGKCIWEKGFKKKENELLHTLIGITVLFLLELIPYIGGLVGFISLLVGLGLIFKSMRK